MISRKSETRDLGVTSIAMEIEYCMSESAAKMLEGAAQKYASEAIRFDSQGARGMAIRIIKTPYKHSFN